MNDRLILFDIDGTLVLDDGASREAYALGLKEVFGFETTLRQYDFSGRTDPQITHMVLGDAGFSASDIDARIEDLWEVYVAELEKRASAERVRLLPGVIALLDRLATYPHLTLALLTGNIEPGARLKLNAQNLNGYFAFGAFGSDSTEREDLPPIAVQRASDLHQKKFEAKDVVVIGDSIYDVRCGIPHRATTIAVATGRTTKETLMAENPDYFFHTLESTDEIASVIAGV